MATDKYLRSRRERAREREGREPQESAVGLDLYSCLTFNVKRRRSDDLEFCLSRAMLPRQEKKNHSLKIRVYGTAVRRSPILIVGN